MNAAGRSDLPRKPDAVSVAAFLLYLLAGAEVGAALLDAAVHRHEWVVADLVLFFGYAALAIQCGAGGRLVRPAVGLLCMLHGVPAFIVVFSREVIHADRAGAPRWYEAGTAAVLAGGFALLLQAWILLDRPASIRFFERPPAPRPSGEEPYAWSQPSLLEEGLQQEARG